MVQAATTPDGPGHPCKVLLGQKVASVVSTHSPAMGLASLTVHVHQNAEAGIVTVANGTEFSADVVIGKCSIACYVLNRC
jgi:hypothetical protein